MARKNAVAASSQNMARWTHVRCFSVSLSWLSDINRAVSFYFPILCRVLLRSTLTQRRFRGKHYSSFKFDQTHFTDRFLCLECPTFPSWRTFLCICHSPTQLALHSREPPGPSLSTCRPRNTAHCTPGSHLTSVLRSQCEGWDSWDATEPCLSRCPVH